MGNGEKKLQIHMTINEINTTLLLECHYQSLLSDRVITSDCDSNVDFGQMMRQKYVVSNISTRNFMWKIHSYTSVGCEEKSNVTSSVTNYVADSISKVTNITFESSN